MVRKKDYISYMPLKEQTYLLVICFAGALLCALGGVVLLEVLSNWLISLKAAGVWGVVSGVLVLSFWVYWSSIEPRRQEEKAKLAFDKKSYNALESMVFGEAYEVYKTVFNNRNPKAPAERLLTILCAMISLEEISNVKEGLTIVKTIDLLRTMRDKSFPDSSCIELKEDQGNITLQAGSYSVSRSLTWNTSTLDSGAHLTVYPAPSYKVK